jgi:hypothetical protein
MIAAMKAPTLMCWLLMVQPLPGLSPARDRVDQRRDDVVRECLDQGAERQCHHQADRDDDQFTLHQEVLEALQHVVSSVRTHSMTDAALDSS